MFHSSVFYAMMDYFAANVTANHHGQGHIMITFLSFFIKGFVDHCLFVPGSEASHTPRPPLPSSRCSCCPLYLSSSMAERTRLVVSADLENVRQCEERVRELLFMIQLQTEILGSLRLLIQIFSYLFPER